MAAFPLLPEHSSLFRTHCILLCFIISGLQTPPHSSQLGPCIYTTLNRHHRCSGWKGLSPFRPGFSSLLFSSRIFLQSLIYGLRQRHPTWAGAHSQHAWGLCWCQWALKWQPFWLSSLNFLGLAFTVLSLQAFPNSCVKILNKVLKYVEQTQLLETEY